MDRSCHVIRVLDMFDSNFIQVFQSHFGFDNLVTVNLNGASRGLILYYNNDY